MYNFTNTERNNFKASSYETKSLLYLIGSRRDRKDITIITVDCFNDVTGMDDTGHRLWDVQSKGEKNLTPYKIGKYLFTLYDNYDSKFTFYKYVFFMPPLKKTYLKSDVTHKYKFYDFTDKNSKKIKEGLISELNRKQFPYLNTNIDDFLHKVIFIEDRKKNSTYIKDVFDFSHKTKINNQFYDEIFKEIRDMQSSKKNSYIEGETIATPIDVIKFNRHIRSEDIKTLIVNRFVGIDLFNQNLLPISFMDEVRDLEHEDVKDLVQDCKANISRAFFNKNSKREFWLVFNQIIYSLNYNQQSSIRNTLKDIDSKTLSRLSFLNSDTILFLTALIKDGLEHDSKKVCIW